MFDLRAPFWGHILEGGGGHDREADKEDVRLEIVNGNIIKSAKDDITLHTWG